MIAQNTFDQQMSMCLSLHKTIDVVNRFIVRHTSHSRKQYIQILSIKWKTIFTRHSIGMHIICLPRIQYNNPSIEYFQGT